MRSGAAPGAPDETPAGFAGFLNVGKRGIGIAVVAALAAAFPPAAAGWSTPRTIASPRYGHDLGLAFNARGDALLRAHSDDGGFTALRLAGGRFGRPRPYRAKNVYSDPFAVLDPNRGALLLGDWYHDAPELYDPDSRDDCCERVFALPVSPAGRSRKRQVLTPYGIRSSLRHVVTDERGGAGLALVQGEDLYAAVRRPGRRVGKPYRIHAPADLYFGDFAIRPDGRGVALWHAGNDTRIDYATISRGGAFGEARTLFRVRAKHQIGLVELVFGRRGHAWATWTARAPRRDAPDVRYAAPQRPDGRFGRARRVGGSGGFAVAAVDDSGDMTGVWQDGRGLVARFVPRDGPVGRARRVVRATRLEPVGVAAGPGGRTVVAWEVSRRVARRVFVDDLYAAAGRRGRFGPPSNVVRSPDDRNLSYATVGMTTKGTAILGWNESSPNGPGRHRVRYSVLRP